MLKARRSRRIPGAVIGRPKGPPSKVVRLPAAIASLVHGLGNGRFRAGMIGDVLSIDPRWTARVPLMGARAACGFPSPADDYLEGALDFNELLIINPAATFAVRVTGESMTGAGIFPGDIAIIDRSLTPKSGQVVLALVDGEFTLKRYCRKRGGQIVLQAENAKFQDILIEENTSFEIWGVVSNSIRVF